MQSHTLGKRGEDIAAVYLRCKGYKILERNFCIRGGEIDLICRSHDAIVFVEVKTRKNVASGYPEEAITRVKLNRLNRAVEAYVDKHAIRLPIRIEVVSVVFAKRAWPTITHITEVGT